MGIFEQIAEESRALNAAAATAGLNKDDRFWKSLSYAFRIFGPTIDTFHPLVLNPTVYRKTFPFSAELTATQEGGVFVEEQGIIISELRIEAHTGFRPTLNRGDTASPKSAVPLSGQAHFTRLERLCFERYSELKKDPEVGPRTRMEWHNFKDNEHFVVVPVSFGVNRSVGGLGRVAYPYEIALKVLGRVDAIPPPPSEDDFVIKNIVDAFAAIERGAAQLEAGFSDLQGILDDVQNAVVDDALAEVDRVLLATRGFLTGVTDTIAIPYDAIRTTQARLDEAVSIVDQAANIPADATQILRDTDDALDNLGTYPDKFKEPFPQAARRFIDLTRGPGNSSTADLEAAAATTITQPLALRDSGLRPGDLVRVQGGVFSGARAIPEYEGFREQVVALEDTLPKLAARHLDDARRWIDIAIANQLKAPYISEEGLPGTLRPGATILIPTRARGGTTGEIRSVEAGQEAVLGRDLEFAFDNQGRADLVIDVAGGSTDFKTVAGARNMKQAVLFILSTEKGQDTLYVNLGTSRIVGQRGTLERVIESQLRISEAILADPRVIRVNGVDFSFIDDVFEVELDVVLIDGTQDRVIGQLIS